jgi:hypothetical protein
VPVALLALSHGGRVAAGRLRFAGSVRSPIRGWYYPSMERLRHLFTRLLVAALLSALTLVATASAPARVVAVGDVHGAFTEFTNILQQAGLIDGKRRWTGGTDTLVQTGDVIDRGPRTRECLDLVMNLEQQAAKAGGALIPLIGNHEAMNVMGDVRYVTPEIYRTFATTRSDEVRAQAYQDYRDFLSAHAGHRHSIVPPNDDAARRKWVDEHPAGYFEYRDALGPEGKYGRWIRGHNVIVQVGDGLFVHGGLNPALPFETVADLDAQVRTELAGFDELWQALSRKKVVWRYMTLSEALVFLEEERRWILTQSTPADPTIVGYMQKLLGYRQWAMSSPDGPLWYRGLTRQSETDLSPGFNALLARLGARYMVVGHTVMAKATVTTWLGNRVFAIDTGMLAEEYKGRASALEIRDGQFKVFYGDGTSRTLEAPAPLAVKAPIS